jgi:hypothetical protein
MMGGYVILREEPYGRITGSNTVYDSHEAAVEQLLFTREYVNERLAPLVPSMPQPAFYLARLEVLDE